MLQVMTMYVMKNRVFQGIAVLSAMLFLAQGAWAKPLTFKVAGGPGNQVVFNSDAPVEVITGKTDKVTGEIRFDDSLKFDAAHPFKVEFTVDVASFDTGIALRNDHMRDNFLDTKQFPASTFKATSIKLMSSPNLKKPQTIKLVSTGDFTMHGVTVKKTIPLTVDYRPGKPATVQIHGKFSIPLAQHHVKRPEAIFMKLAETIYVNLDLKGVAQ